MSAGSDVAFAQDLVARTLAEGADAAQAVTREGTAFEVNFDSRRLTLLRSRIIDAATLTAFCGGRKGSATLTGRDPAAVDSAVRDACAAAMASPVDPANGLAEDAVTAPPARFGAKAADRDGMVQAVLHHLDDMRLAYPLVNIREARYEFSDVTRSFASSTGASRRERRGCYLTGALFNARRDGQSTSMAHHGASAFAPFARLLDSGEFRRMFADASRSFDPQPVPEKFVGDIILTPEAVSPVLLGPLANAISGYALLAGTTPFRNRLGQMIAMAGLSLYNQPAAADFVYGAAFDDYGLPNHDLTVLRDGVLANFLVDHYISRKLGMPRTAGWWSFRVPGGDSPLAEIVAATRRGVILSRFSGGTPSTDLDFSGIAKNAFYIEDGVVRHALRETMISGNLQDLMPRIRALSRETVNSGGTEVPAIAAGGITISGG
ncbi:MAG TPA: TldD/PmbA family protein [Acetobacteraceae bacterium]|nr:TldD/PmbA family protein [Acetobacteraceae bacterium]